ncbi:hypothetical protein Q5P01_000832 [Channa striata]|uniref:Uncharacterized protein n=1 Tax=Channa striata TaxID=64152 RepID=A0AA88IRF1_CHASR|nr:hypothetical protein Q5P01_000832 [Channa striata]
MRRKRYIRRPTRPPPEPPRLELAHLALALPSQAPQIRTACATRSAARRQTGSPLAQSARAAAPVVLEEPGSRSLLPPPKDTDDPRSRRDRRLARATTDVLAFADSALGFVRRVRSMPGGERRRRRAVSARTHHGQRRACHSSEEETRPLDSRWRSSRCRQGSLQVEAARSSTSYAKSTTARRAVLSSTPCRGSTTFPSWPTRETTSWSCAKRRAPGRREDAARDYVNDTPSGEGPAAGAGKETEAFAADGRQHKRLTSTPPPQTLDGTASSGQGDLKGLARGMMDMTLSSGATAARGQRSSIPTPRAAARSEPPEVRRDLKPKAPPPLAPRRRRAEVSLSLRPPAGI